MAGPAPGRVTTGGPPVGQFTPPGVRPGQLPTLTARLPEGTPSFRPGSVIHGQVTGQDSSGYQLRLGDKTLTAKSAVPLNVGQSVQLRVQGQDNGQLMLNLVKTPFTKLDTNDLATNLTGLRVPPSEANLELAKSMVELGIPLTKENFTALLTQTALPDGTKNPPPLQARASAVVFMQQNQIPMTPQNMLTLSQFMAANPQLGQQMFALNGELRKLSRSMDGKALDILKDLPGIAEENGLGMGDAQKSGKASKPPPGPSKKLFNMAKELGIETNLAAYGGGEDAYELLAELRRFREENEAGGEDMQKLLSLVGDIEGNVEAQKLINQARPEQLFGFYYLQFPLFGGNDGVEVWIRYNKEDDGHRTVDAEDCRLEFLVTTEHMGELFFAVEIKGNALDLQVGVPSEEVREYVTRYLPVLQDRLEQMAWSPVTARSSFRAHTGRRELVEHTDFEQIESCNVQA